jgi:hypothetical protein
MIGDEVQQAHVVSQLVRDDAMPDAARPWSTVAANPTVRLCRVSCSVLSREAMSSTQTFSCVDRG